MGAAMTPHPPPPQAARIRAARSVVFAAVCVVLAAAGHAAASHTAVPAWAMLAGFGAVFGVCHLLSGHERSLWTIMGGVLGGQFALHTLFAGAAEPARHHVTGAVPPPEHASSGAGMTFAHIGAAVVAAWWLRRGEHAMWTLARRVADRPIRLLPALLAVEPAAPPTRTAHEPVAVAVIGRVLRHQVVRRGPPSRSRTLAT